VTATTATVTTTGGDPDYPRSASSVGST
jgi:hypothetical protein